MSHSAPQPVMLRLGTRQSPLAMAQAVEARERLCAAHGWAEDAVELVSVLASGDKVQDRPLADIGGKALWTKELDQWLLEGRIDAAVHSMKDVETLRPANFAIAAVLPRADRRDVLVGAPSIEAIPKGARVGTSAPRRAAQILGLRPDCSIVSFRGNVATRLARLERGEADVTFLAAAGLERLGVASVGTPLETDQWLPAAAQGAIGIECLADNAKVLALLAPVNDPASMAEVRADRALLAGLGGTCHSPVAVLSLCKADRIAMKAALFSEDGAEMVTGEAEFACGDDAPPHRLARDLLARAVPAIARHFQAAE